jgi:large subunit ribosomal protein L53
MITKFLTEVTTKFNPFSPGARSARLFLSLLPPDARHTMTINTTLLPKTSREPSSLSVKFSASKPWTPTTGSFGAIAPGRVGFVQNRRC